MKNIISKNAIIVDLALKYLDNQGANYNQKKLLTLIENKYNEKIHQSELSNLKKKNLNHIRGRYIRTLIEQLLYECFSVAYSQSHENFISVKELDKAELQDLEKRFYQNEETPTCENANNDALIYSSDQLDNSPLEQPIGILGFVKRRVYFNEYLNQGVFKSINSLDELDDFKYYVSPHGYKDKSSDKKLMDLTEAMNEIFYKKRKRNKFYALLGDSGMGKTTFFVNLIEKCLKDFRIRNKEIYLFYLSNQRLDFFEAIKRIKNKSRSILLIDAFDEDLLARKNYKKRLKEITYATESFDTVVISSRPQIFPKVNLEPSITNLPNSGTGPKFHEYTRFYMTPFSDDLIREILQKKYKGKLEDFNTSWEFLQKFKDLKRRPLLIRYIDDLEKYNPTCLYESYEIIVDRWAEREQGKTRAPWLVDASKKIANYMHQKKEYFLTIEELDGFDVRLDKGSIRHRSLLTRNSNDQYVFVHNSFMEYLLACYYFENGKVISNALEEFSGLSDAVLFYNELVFRREFYPLIKTVSGYYCTDISKNKLEDLDNMTFNEVSRIKKIKLQETDLSFNTILLEQLSLFECLEELEVHNCSIKHLNNLGDIPNLSKCNISYNQLDKMALSSLKKYQNLEELILCNNQITDIMSLKSNSLWFLDISFNPVEQLDIVVNIPNLKCLHFSADSIHDWSSLDFLTGLSSIKIYGAEYVPQNLLNKLKASECILELEYTRFN